MINADKYALKVKGENGDVLFELDEIINYAIHKQPEMLQAIIIHRGKDLLTADVDPEKYKAFDDLIAIKIALEKDGDYDEDEL